MNTGLDFPLAGMTLTALPSGALWWAHRQLLCVSDLHLGKSDRIARRSGALIPPYEVRETLARLEKDIETTAASTVICLGDSFDDLSAADSLDEDEKLWLTRLQAGRRWIWIEGNHDPGPVEFGGSHMADFSEGPLTFRHIADPDQTGEISGHYHPKTRVVVRGKVISRRSLLFDQDRVIVPAYGTYTGGLRSDERVLQSLMGDGAHAILTGSVPRMIPMPKG